MERGPRTEERVSGYPIPRVAQIRLSGVRKAVACLLSGHRVIPLKQNVGGHKHSDSGFCDLKHRHTDV